MTKLDDLFPTPTSLKNLRKVQVQGFEDESEETWLEAIDALLKLGRVSGKDLREGSRLVAAANLVITERGQEELHGAPKPQTFKPESDPDSNLVFLSHAAKDQEIAICLKKAIESAIPKSDVFVSSDTEDLRPGDDWVEKIQDNLGRAKILILLASERGLKRTWVWYESGAAWSRSIRMIPCCIGKIRKNQLPAPFSSRQALNADDAQDLGHLLSEIGRELALGLQMPDLQPIVSRLQTLDKAAHESDMNMLTPDEIQRRVDQMNVSAIARGHFQQISVELKNESPETVTISYIQLYGRDLVPVSERYTLPLEPSAKRTLPPNGRLQVEMNLQSDPALKLVSFSPEGYSTEKPRIQVLLTIEVGCEVLTTFKQCRTNRQVQVDVRNHNIEDYL
ncbi:MAG: toll/interleukin-1 receptor domain-containing protein [Candidatus Acidiferrales bacterium]